MLELNILSVQTRLLFLILLVRITIHSRFSSDYERDYFMQYLLQKVFAINIFDLNHSRSEENALDIAVLLFPYFLQKALLQGLFREYQRINYNDDRVKGTIDFNRHIKMNYPFLNGKVSYSTKEFRYDNPITQLIRHTIEYIRSKRKSSYILFASQEIKLLEHTSAELCNFHIIATLIFNFEHRMPQA